MLGRIEFVLKNKNINMQMGSLFQGFLMENIDTNYAEILHSPYSNPYSQFLYFDKKKDKYVWRINTLNEEAYKNIILKLSEIKEINIKHKSLKIEIVSTLVQEPKKIDDFATEIYLENSKKYIGVKFLTPTSFKSNGYYQNYPRIDLLYYSAAKKMNEFSNSIKIIDKEVMDYLINTTRISQYKLRSTNFHLEKVKINSFIGDVSLHLSSNDEVKRLAMLLIKYCEYAGIGIKTSIGMGGVIIE